MLPLINEFVTLFWIFNHEKLSWSYCLSICNIRELIGPGCLKWILRHLLLSGICIGINLHTMYLCLGKNGWHFSSWLRKLKQERRKRSLTSLFVLESWHRVTYFILSSTYTYTRTKTHRRHTCVHTHTHMSIYI